MLAFIKAITNAMLNHLPVNQHKQTEYLDKVLAPARQGVEIESSCVTRPSSKAHECDPDNLFTWDVMEGRGSGSTGEARFKCRTCSREMFLGGWGSELWLDPSVVRRNQAKQAA